MGYDKDISSNARGSYSTILFNIFLLVKEGINSFVVGSVQQEQPMSSRILTYGSGSSQLVCCKTTSLLPLQGYTLQ